MRDVLNAVGSVGLAIVGLAVIAVLVSRNSNTSAVIGSAGGAFSSGITAAVSPVTSRGAF